MIVLKPMSIQEPVLLQPPFVSNQIGTYPSDPCGATQPRQLHELTEGFFKCADGASVEFPLFFKELSGKTKLQH